jgi:glutamate-1-semialdehyde 2,1-aminomutase
MPAFVAWHAAMLQAGVYLAPSQFEAMFVSAEHSQAEIDQTISAAEAAFAQAARLM